MASFTVFVTRVKPGIPDPLGGGGGGGGGVIQPPCLVNPHPRRQNGHSGWCLPCQLTQRHAGCCVGVLRTGPSAAGVQIYSSLGHLMIIK